MASATAEAKAAWPAYEKKKRVHESRNGQGRPPKPPDDEPPPSGQSNLTDPDSALMRKSKRQEYCQAYNAQAVVDAGGSQLVLVAGVFSNPSDAPTFETMIDRLCDEVGPPATVLGDTGFAQEQAVAAIEARGIEALVAIGRPEGERRYDFRPPKQNARPPPKTQVGWRAAMKQKLETDAAKAKYKLRKCTVESVFGIVKNVLGFTHFHLRGLEGVILEWLLVTMAYNTA